MTSDQVATITGEYFGTKEILIEMDFLRTRG